MRAARYDQVYLVPIAHNKARALRVADTNPQLVDREFSDEYRSPRLPAGWFILPSGLITLVGMFFLHF